MVMVMGNDVGREPYARMPVRCAGHPARRTVGRTVGRPTEVSRGSDSALLSVTDHGPSIEGRARESRLEPRASSLDSDNRIGAVGGCAKSGSSSPGPPDPRCTGMSECECVSVSGQSFREPRAAARNESRHKANNEKSMKEKMEDEKMRNEK